MLQNIRIVLVNTSHPGNIGSAARALKTMGLTELYLVAPHKFPHPNANEMAAHALDIVEQAKVVKTLDEAIADCSFVVGSSARSRTIPWPVLAPRALAEKVAEVASTTQVAIVFGNEQSGLSNEELTRCHYHVQIPSNPDYSSLNLAAAVQVIAYELRVACVEPVSPTQAWDYQWASAKEMEGFYEHLQRVMVEIDFLNPDVPRQLMPRLRRLFNRAQPDVMEMNILRGILGNMEKKIASLK